MSIPHANNDTRSFYKEDDDLSLSAIITDEQQAVSETPSSVRAAEQTEQGVREKTLLTQYVEGFKINTSGFLEKNLHGVRSSIIGKLNYVEAEYKNLKSAAVNEWRNLTDGVTSLYDPRDEVLPSAIYALTLMLSGSILVNKKSLPVRFVAPVAFGLAGFKMFLPRTFNNTLERIKGWEAEEYPELLQAQRSLKQVFVDGEEFVQETAEGLNQSLINTVHEIRTSIAK